MDLQLQETMLEQGKEPDKPPVYWQLPQHLEGSGPDGHG